MKEELEPRLVALEIAHRRLKVMMWVSAFGLGMAISWTTYWEIVPRSGVRTRTLEIVDSEGRTRISLGSSTEDVKQSNPIYAPALRMYDVNGTQRVGVGLYSEHASGGTNQPALLFYDHTRARRMFVGMKDNVTPQIELQPISGASWKAP